MWDLPRSSLAGPLLGFILMVDSFTKANGATRFVLGSHRWPEAPEDGLTDTRAQHAEEVLATGEAGSMVVFNAAIWHGHTANETQQDRRSIQGYFVRRAVAPAFDFQDRLPNGEEFSSKARHLLGLEAE